MGKRLSIAVNAETRSILKAPRNFPGGAPAADITSQLRLTQYFTASNFRSRRAFYIAYLTVAGKKDYTLDALAVQLDLRMNTVWSFKHKVSERIHELSRGGNHPLASKWEEVILLNEPATRKPNAKKVTSNLRALPLD